MAKIKPAEGLPAELLGHLEAMWPVRTLVERTIWIRAHEGSEYTVEVVEKKIREDLLKAVVEQGLGVLKINPPRWYRRSAELAPRQVLNDADPIPADRRDIPWTLADPVLLTDVLICRFSAEAVPALLEESAVEEVPDDGEQ